VTYTQWAESFAIFAKYEPKGRDVNAQHDELWAGPDANKISVEDHERLVALGWDCDPDEGGWHIFT
jgi:hypothetical protein